MTDAADDRCGLDAHLHTVVYPAVVGPGALVVMYDGTLAALCVNRVVADRLVQLLNEHGLLTVDDGMPLLPWPPPAGPRHSSPGAVDSQ